jgi:hypothetical protein
MTLKHGLELEAIFFVALGAFISFVFIGNNQSAQQFNANASAPVIMVTPMLTPTPATTPTTTSQISPNGKKQVIAETIQNKDYSYSYTLYVADGSGNDKQVVFSKNFDTSGSVAIPFNTWSPDNRYFFIEETEKGIMNVLVFKASGEPFANTAAYLNLTDAFNKRNTGNNYDVATGWASETLIIINTTTQENKKGPSYWFEVPSTAIIQLSTRF